MTARLVAGLAALLVVAPVTPATAHIVEVTTSIALEAAADEGRTFRDLHEPPPPSTPLPSSGSEGRVVPRAGALRSRPGDHRQLLLRRASIRSPVAGCVEKNPPEPPPLVSTSQLRVSIMTSLGCPTLSSNTTPWRSAAYSSERL